MRHLRRDERVFMRGTVLVAIDFPSITTPLVAAQRRWKTTAILLLLGLISFAIVLSLTLPDSTEVNEGRDRVEEKRQQECGPLKLDFSDPCNSAAIMLVH
jgi:hypothetical protein